MERKHIQKAYAMLMTMKMFKMSTSFSRFQTEDVKNKQDLHRKDTGFRRPFPLACKIWLQIVF